MDGVNKASKRPRNSKEEEDLSTISLCLPITTYTTDLDGKSVPSNTLPPPPPPPPPPAGVGAIPNNQASVRGSSRKVRVYVFRSFLLDTYRELLLTHHPTTNNTTDHDAIVPSRQVVLLDVAGGKGDLSWLLVNASRSSSSVPIIDSIIMDPRTPHHGHFLKSIRFLLDHPQEAKQRAIPNLDTHQPLATLLPQLMAGVAAAAAAVIDSHTNTTSCPEFLSPKYMKILVDDALVRTIRSILQSNEEGLFHQLPMLSSLDCLTESSLLVWDEYWKDARHRAESLALESNKVTAPQVPHSVSRSHVEDGREALLAVLQCRLWVGFHPDQATEATIDLCLFLERPFAVVPCCVFPSEFPHRMTPDGRNIVRHYPEFIPYLLSKDTRIRTARLDFRDTQSARNLVLYMLPEDYTPSPPKMI